MNHWKRMAVAWAAGLMLIPAACAEDAVTERMKHMTLREKVGQLFVIRPDALEGRFGPAELEDNSITGTTVVTDEMRAVYAQYPCGGFALFRKNILSPSQLTRLTESLHAIGGGVVPLLAIDEEGGRVARIANHPTSFGVEKFEPMGKIAAAGDAQRAYQVGSVIGAYLKAYGIDVDFAPVFSSHSLSDLESFAVAGFALPSSRLSISSKSSLPSIRKRAQSAYLRA